MTMETVDRAAEVLTGNFDGVRDVMSVKRVFGEAYEVDGATVIPVARLGGGAGGGGGGDDHGGGGFGTGFGVGASPVGVYAVRDGEITWKPAVDVGSLLKSFAVLAGIVSICAAHRRRVLIK